MIMALKLGPFSDTLPATLHELRVRVAKFIQMEEMTRFKEKVQEQLWYFKKMLGAAKILNAPSISPSGNIITGLTYLNCHLAVKAQIN